MVYREKPERDLHDEGLKLYENTLDRTTEHNIGLSLGAVSTAAGVLTPIVEGGANLLTPLIALGFGVGGLIGGGLTGFGIGKVVNQCKRPVRHYRDRDYDEIHDMVLDALLAKGVDETSFSGVRDKYKQAILIDYAAHMTEQDRDHQLVSAADQMDDKALETIAWRLIREKKHFTLQYIIENYDGKYKKNMTDAMTHALKGAVKKYEMDEMDRMKDLLSEYVRDDYLARLVVLAKSRPEAEEELTAIAASGTNTNRLPEAQDRPAALSAHEEQ
jgi:hypothetical protein